MLQASHSREVSPEALVRRRTGPMHSVLLRVYAFWTDLKRSSPSKRENGHPYMSTLVNAKAKPGSRHMNVSLLLSWLSARQYAPEGGFAGRTNKLVDGCYSHWVGGCWPLVQSALDGMQPAGAPNKESGNLYSREGLTRYILSCCQAKQGLRDKPGK